MAILCKYPFTDTPGIIFHQISGYHMAQSGWHIKLTIVSCKWLSQDLNSQMSSSKICTGLERWWETKEKKKWKEREVGERKMMKKIDRDLSIMTISAFLPVRKPFFPKSRILCTPLFHGSQTIKGWGDFRDGKMNIQRKCDILSECYSNIRINIYITKACPEKNYPQGKNGKNKQCDLKKGACWNRGWAMEARGVLEITD